jgi:hypothetical protein
MVCAFTARQFWISGHASADSGSGAFMFSPFQALPVLLFVS